MDMNFFVNFKEDTGEIWKATNELDNSSPYIEIDADTYSEFTTGAKNMQDYIVVPAVSEKKFEIKFKHRDLNHFDVDKSIHRIPVSNTDNHDNTFMIIQKDSKWFVKLSDDMKETLTSTAYYKDKSQFIYITKKNDPNILLDTLEIRMYNVLYSDDYEIENIKKSVAERNDVSLFCGKVFENYLHVVKDEN